MALTDRQIVVLTERLQVLIGQISGGATNRVQDVWRLLESYHVADVDGFARQVAPLIAAAQEQAAVATNAYMAAVTGNQSMLAVSTGETLGSVPPAVREPFISVWTNLQAGHPVSVSLEAGEARVASMVSDAVMGAHRLQVDACVSRATSGGARVVGYRRVLSGTACEFCVTVSRQRYHTAESAHFGHGKAPCRCTVAPIVGRADPGQNINAVRLDGSDYDATPAA